MTFSLLPQDTVSESDLNRGLRMLMLDGVCSQVMGVLSGGAFLVAFAMLSGASNFIIGLIAALGPLTQVLQIPAIYLIEKTGYRKALVVVSSFFSRLFWFLIAVIPFLFPTSYRSSMLFIALLAYFGLGTISGLSFNSWMRDFIPDSIRGSYSGKRMAIATAVAAFLSLAAGFGVDMYKKFFPEIGIYSIYFAVGGFAGILGVSYLARIPEPKMEKSQDMNLINVIIEPFRDLNFRQLMVFLGSWNFAVNFAAPFFIVYMLKRLNLNMTLIVALSVLSQIVNILFFRLWGKLADRFSNKSVLAEAGPLFIITMLIWPFTTMPESYFLTIPMVLMIHILAGMSMAGVNLCSGNIALKLAPTGKSTSYLAANALVSGVAATIAPIIGGALATILDGEELSLTLRWISTAFHTSWELPTVNLKGLDFICIISFLLGLHSLHRLLTIKETGEVEQGVFAEEFRLEVRKAVKNISNVAGMRDMFYFPYSRLRELIIKRNQSK
jgi:MFS family permease